MSDKVSGLYIKRINPIYCKNKSMK